jgi:hypothetical protein
MRHRGFLPAKERQARSRLAKLLHQKTPAHRIPGLHAPGLRQARL